MEKKKKSYKIIFIQLILLIIICSCKNQQDVDSDKIVYLISKKNENEVLKGISNLDKEKLIVSVNLTEDGKFNLCFTSFGDSFKKKIAIKSNRFLKLDKLLIPVIFKEDFVFDGSTELLNTTGCDFQYYNEIFY